MKFYLATHRGHGWERVQPACDYDTVEAARKAIAASYSDMQRRHQVAVLCKRWALTHIDRNDVRVLTSANRGQYHYETREAAEKMLDSFLKNNSPERLAQLFGDRAPSTFAVREIECYSHGDAVGIYFDK